MSLRPVKFGLLCVTLAILPAELLADWRQSYKDGVRAYDSKQWDAVVVKMKAAIAENGKESPVRDQHMYGASYYVPYVPYYYLGYALARLGRCGEAVAAFAESERQGASLKDGEYAANVKSRLGCKAPDVPLVATQTTPAPAPAAKSEPELRLPTPAPAPVLVATPPPPPVAPTVASQPNKSDPALVAARDALDREIRDARNLLGTQPIGTKTAAARPGLTNAITAGAKLGASATLADVLSMGRAIDASVTAYRSAAAEDSARAVLVQAVDLYARGKYDLVPVTLSRIDAAAGKTIAAHAALVRAASRYSLYELGGERDRSLYDQVTKDLQLYASNGSAAKLDARKAKLDPRRFSPKFQDRVRQVLR